MKPLINLMLKGLKYQSMFCPNGDSYSMRLCSLINFRQRKLKLIDAKRFLSIWKYIRGVLFIFINNSIIWYYKSFILFDVRRYRIFFL